MISIIAVINAFLSATVLANPVATDIHECTIQAPRFSSSVSIKAFNGSQYQSPANKNLGHELLWDDLAEKGQLQVSALFEANSSRVVPQISFMRYFGNEYESVDAFWMNSTLIVRTSYSSGMNDATTEVGTYNVLNNFVTYIVKKNADETTVSFIINGDIFIDVLEWQFVPGGKPVIRIKQSTRYDHAAGFKPFGLCTGPNY